MKSFFAIALALCIAPGVLMAQTQHTGILNGAEYIIDVPAEPSGDVMFIARGFRPAFFPLSPVYEVDTEFYQTLLQEGWTIASTSFQTNAWVVEEGAEDILALQTHIEAAIHPIRKSILYGETMGGGVAVWLAENYPGRFAAVFALGAHLFPEPSENETTEPTLADVFTADPKLPILFVANVEEAASSVEYTKRSSGAEYRPAIWTIRRPGHVNVNSAERLAAMRALMNWAEGGSIDSKSDATIRMSPKAVAARLGNVAAGSIRGIRPLYGNIYTNFVPQDLEALEIRLGDNFTVTHATHTYEITYAKAYSDVPYEAWVAFIDPEGYVQISRNYANAADTLDALTGDPLLIANP